MHDSNLPLKKLFTIPFSITDPGQPLTLLLRVGENHFSFAIVNDIASRVYQLGYYSLDKNVVDDISNIYDEEKLGDHNYFKVLIAFDYPQFVLVPHEVYVPDEQDALLRSSHPIVIPSHIVAESIAPWHLYNIYALPSNARNWLAKKFPSANYWHQFSIYLNSLDPADESPRIIIDFRKDDFTVAATARGKLLVAQTYNYTSSEDVLYFLLKICQDHELSQQDVVVEISGLIDKQSAMYKELYQYFIHINLRDVKWQVEESEYPPHFFTTLNDLANADNQR